MKSSLFLLVPVFMLAACDSKEQYSNSNLLALSALYDFEAVKGNVRELNQTLYNVKDEIVHQVVARFEPNGCVSELILDSKMYGKAHLTKQEQQLTGTEQGSEVVFALGDKCEILSKRFTRLSDNYTYQYDDRARLQSLFYSVTGLTRHFTWNEQGLLTRTKSTIGEQVIDEVIQQYADPLHKPADYRSETHSLAGNTIIDMRCQYQGVVPHSCEVVKQATANEAEEKFHASIAVAFYPH